MWNKTKKKRKKKKKEEKDWSSNWILPSFQPHWVISGRNKKKKKKKQQQREKYEEYLETVWLTH